jgi:hypothetical protein
MHTVIRSLLFVALACTLSAQAELVKVKGKGEIVYKSNIFKPGQGSTEERAAISEAKKNALTRFAADFDSARFELYKRIEAEVLANIDQYVTDYTQLDQQVDKTSKRYTVIIEASVNATLIENAIQKRSGAAAQTAAGTTTAKAGGSYMTFVFVARELASRKDFDAKRTTVEINESSEAGAQKGKVAEDGQSAEVGVDKSSVVKRTSGGNTETKANELAYRVSTVTEVDNAVNSVLTKAKYEVVDPVDAGLDVGSFKGDFSSGSDIAPATRSAAIKTCKEKEISYIAIANMDVGLPEKDEASGLTRVYVTVTAKISDLAPRFPKTVASIAGKPYAGLGSNAQVAKQNALNEAATRSAGELVDQLRMKDVK